MERLGHPFRNFHLPGTTIFCSAGLGSNGLLTRRSSRTEVSPGGAFLRPAGIVTRMLVMKADIGVVFITRYDTHNFVPGNRGTPCPSVRIVCDTTCPTLSFSDLNSR